MKRILVLVLVAMMLCASMAQAAEWTNGRSPSQPYEGQPPVNLDEEFGYLMFYPNKGMAAQNSCQKLFIYLPREDVKAGSATFYLVSLDDNKEIWRTAMDNTDAVTMRPITEPELAGLLWGGGVCFEILLPKTLELGKTYFVNMERGCVVTTNGIDSPEVGGTDAWKFTVEGDWGVNNMEYIHTAVGAEEGETVAHPQVGDEIRFELVLGGEATMAVLYGYGDSVDFLTTMYQESTTVTGTVAAASPSWGVMFLNASGEELSREEFYETTVQASSELDEEIAEELAEEVEELTEG